MIKIVTPEDLQRIQDTNIYPYIRELLFRILKEYANYTPDPSITDEIGAIFLLEQETDWQLYLKWVCPCQSGNHALNL